MNNFMIIFSYDNEEYTAAVTKSKVGARTDYAIHPTSPEIIKKFGARITIFKEDENFTVNTSNDESYKDYVDVLTNALQNQERNTL